MKNLLVLFFAAFATISFGQDEVYVPKIDHDKIPTFEYAKMWGPSIKFSFGDIDLLSVSFKEKSIYVRIRRPDEAYKIRKSVSVMPEVKNTEKQKHDVIGIYFEVTDEEIKATRKPTMFCDEECSKDNTVLFRCDFNKENGVPTLSFGTDATGSKQKLKKVEISISK